jgi:c-di-GMP-binding flagellar brake protein YcgR
VRVQDEEARKLILESYLEENAVFMLKTDRITFLSRVLSVSEGEIAVSSPVADYPISGMTVEMHFHDEWGWYSFRSVVTSPPDFDKPRISLTRPVSTERFVHRKYTRVAVDLEARYRPLDGLDLKRARICDLSVGGLLLQTEEKLQPEQKVQIRFSLPGAEIPPMVTTTCQEKELSVNDMPPFYIGCEFVGLNRETMQTIRDYVWQQLKSGLS